MGSHSTQAVGITVFLLAFVALSAAIAGGGVALYLAFLVLLGVSIALMMKCKSMEEAAD
jgi:hypothetical protein